MITSVPATAISNTIRELLGHKSIVITLRYAHLAPEHKTAAVETLVAKERTADAA
jgi:integrase